MCVWVWIHCELLSDPLDIPTLHNRKKKKKKHNHWIRNKNDIASLEMGNKGIYTIVSYAKKNKKLYSKSSNDLKLFTIPTDKIIYTTIYKFKNAPANATDNFSGDNMYPLRRPMGSRDSLASLWINHVNKSHTKHIGGVRILWLSLVLSDIFEKRKNEL